MPARTLATQERTFGVMVLSPPTFVDWTLPRLPILKFKEITPLIDARANFAPLLSDLTGLQKALARDLTPAGIKAIQPFVTKLVAQAEITAKTLDTLAVELNKIVAALPQSTLAPAN